MTNYLNKVICGDSLAVLKGLPDNYVDLVLTDPPYGINYQSARRVDKSQWKPKIANDKLPFIWWLYDAFRVTKDGGALVCFSRWDVDQDFKRSIELAGWTIKSQIIWDRKVHGMGDLKSSFAPQHDTIWFATKGKFQFYNKRPKSVLSYQRVSSNKLIHPNEKPAELLEYLIESLTTENQIILEPFAGSGSTLVACKQLKRNYIGIEISPEYCRVAEDRLEAAKEPEPTLL